MCFSDINQNAFINISSFKDLNEAIEYIRHVDSDQQVYREYNNAPLFEKHITDSEPLDSDLKSFLIHIVDQDYSAAMRRSQSMLRVQLEKDVIPFYERKRKQYNIKSRVYSVLVKNNRLYEYRL